MDGLHRLAPEDFDQIAGTRYGFMIADMVLGDTLREYADGQIQGDELQLALEQHRSAYEGYLRKVSEYLHPMAQA